MSGASTVSLLGHKLFFSLRLLKLISPRVRRAQLFLHMCRWGKGRRNVVGEEKSVQVKLLREVFSPPPHMCVDPPLLLFSKDFDLAHDLEPYVLFFFCLRVLCAGRASRGIISSRHSVPFCCCQRSVCGLSTCRLSTPVCAITESAKELFPVVFSAFMERQIVNGRGDQRK